MRGAPTVGALRASVLIIWTGFLVWLVMSGESNRYVGSRTRWVLFFGIAAVGVSALLQLRALRRAEGRVPADRKEWVGSVSLVVPVAVVFLVPSPSLGADAAQRKTSGTSAIGSFAPQPDTDGEISYPEIVYASRSPEYAQALGISDGYPIELIGFVTQGPDPGSDFALTRFESFCCAADAVPYSVPIEARAFKVPPVDTWLKVSGELAEREGVWVLIAADISPVEEPQDPYI